jgi:hypothetical protein
VNIRLVAFAILAIVIVSIAVFYIFKNKFIEPIKEPANVKICDDIKTYDLRFICLAIFTSDPSKCKDTGDFDTYCYDTVFSVINVSESLCKSFSEYYPRTTCYFNLAKLEKDPSLCLESRGRYQKCSWELAKITKNSALCENIETETEKYECLAEVTRDDSFCKKISIDIERTVCFLTLGKNADIKKCGEDVPIENPSFSYTQICISNVARATKDISLCNEIEDKQTRWSCLSQLSKSIDICEKGENQFWIDFCKIEFIKNSFTGKI